MHTQAHNWEEKVHAAYQSGCMRFDAAIKGYGGCPMAKDDLTGNMATENLLYYFEKEKIELSLDFNAFDQAMEMSSRVFSQH